MHCFDRTREAEILWRLLHEGKNVLMLAPRRIGKTVLLNHLRETGEEHGFRAVVLDVEGYRDERAFFSQCCSSIQEELGIGTQVLTAFSLRLKRLLKGGAEGDDWRKWLVNTDWQEFADHLVAHLDEYIEDMPWLILVDELPIFVHALQEHSGPAGIRIFLYWLRNIRQKHGNVRWLYTGSIGLDSVSRRYGVEGALNDLEPFALGPFLPETASDFLIDVATRRKRTFTPEAIRSVLDRLGWLSPYYLEKIAEDSCAHADADKALDAESVRASMDRMLNLEKRTYWSSWREHLDRNFPEPDRSLLYRVLETVAKTKGGVGRDVLLTALNSPGGPVGELKLRDLLDTLLSDGYLARVEHDSYSFRMKLLCEWWLRYVVM